MTNFHLSNDPADYRSEVVSQQPGVYLARVFCQGREIGRRYFSGSSAGRSAEVEAAGWGRTMASRGRY